MDERERRLGRVVDLGILSPPEWSPVAAACRRVRRALGTSRCRPESWGPVHGDLHHRNVLFSGEQARPIDFGDFTRAPFMYDLGVIWYHTMYQDDIAVRRALLDGYRVILPDAALTPLEAETFVCAAALSNISFQVTIPSQRTSPLFAHNVREFVIIFCRKLVAGEHFVLA